MEEVVVGLIGGSSLIGSEKFAHFEPVVLSTAFGKVSCSVGVWKKKKQPNLKILFCQRHHADEAKTYQQPRNINFRAIVSAMKNFGCQHICGIYSVGSLSHQIPVGKIVVPEDFFNPFDIINISDTYSAHVVPCVDGELRTRLCDSLRHQKIDFHDGGVYVQSAGPRFETKAEVRFFSQFGELIGMTGAHEAELANELRLPFAMLGIVDNMGNGMAEKLSLELFQEAQRQNCVVMEKVVCGILDDWH